MKFRLLRVMVLVILLEFSRNPGFFVFAEESEIMIETLYETGNEKEIQNIEWIIYEEQWDDVTSVVVVENELREEEPVIVEEITYEENSESILEEIMKELGVSENEPSHITIYEEAWEIERVAVISDIIESDYGLLHRDALWILDLLFEDEKRWESFIVESLMIIQSIKSDEERKNQRSSIVQLKDIHGTVQPWTEIKSMILWSVGIEDLTVEELSQNPSGFENEMVWWASLWPDNDHLLFSRPVWLTIPVEVAANVAELEVYVFHEGDTKFSTQWLTSNPNALCNEDGTTSDPGNIVPVSWSTVTIYTCWASTFTVTYTWWPTFANFVDNWTLSKTITVWSWDVVTGTTIQDVQVIIDFHSIDSEDPTSFGTSDASSSEISMVLTAPWWTPSVSLLNVGTYTDDAFAPQVTVTFDDAAWSAPSWLPATGVFSPAGPLSWFDGIDPLWDWTLDLTDSWFQDWVILFSANLQINALECGDWILEGSEVCDDGNTANWDWCSSTCTVEASYVCNTQSPSLCTSCTTEDSIVPYRAIGVDDGRETINFVDITSREYLSPPLVLATPNDASNWNNYSIPRIRNVTQTSFELSRCVDAGSATCTTGLNTEDIGLFIVDVDKAQCTDNIDAGTWSFATAGASVWFAFNDTFTNSPYVYVTPQTANQWNNIATHAWLDWTATLAWGSIIWCSHQWTGDTCTAWSNEDIWRLAIDPVLFSMVWFELWTEAIDDSLWTPISYAWYTEAPVVMVSQNSELWSQDGKYQWAKGVWASGAEIRYCEPDWANYCDSHNAENIRWFSLPYAWCWDWLIDSTEQCDDGNTDDWDWCSSLCMVEDWSVCDGEPSVCTDCDQSWLLLWGSISSVTTWWQTISFNNYTNHSYTSTPYVFATPSSQNNWDNYPIPRLRNISLTWFQISACVDAGSAICDAAAVAEDFSFFVVDEDASVCNSALQVWSISAASNGSNSAISFSGSFDNVPYIFTTPQTSSQWNNIAAHAWADDIWLWWGNILWCTHQWIANACDAATPAETVWWLAIDTSLFTYWWFQSWTDDISNSEWTAINFSPDYTELPVVMVTQNDDDWVEDGQYWWARNISLMWAEYRYCEPDWTNYCDNHTSEFVRRFSLPVSENTGDVCISTPTWFSFTWIEVSNIAMSYEQQFTWYFQVDDSLGSDMWWYTTLAITDFTWSIYWDVIWNSALEWKADSGIDVLSWSANPRVEINSWFSSYSVATWSVTFIERSSSPNAWVEWVYWVLPTLRFTVPAYSRPDTYEGTITYTLYEN